MKKMFILISLIFFSSAVFSQTNERRKIEKVGDLFEVTIYNKDGKIIQHGFLSKDEKLHASWESFYEDGTRKCIATYSHGAKVGTWFYYDKGKKTKVIYENNKIVHVEKLDSIQN